MSVLRSGRRAAWGAYGAGGGAASEPHPCRFTWGAVRRTLYAPLMRWALQDSNLRASDYESAALTAELRARFVAFRSLILPER